jgi:hypothetical protein
MSARGSGVLLLSAAPDAHGLMVQTLRRRGIRVSIPAPGAALRALDGGPDVILVDLVHGTGMTRDVVARLNRRRGGIVVALHEGALDGPPDVAADLIVEGYCRSTDWELMLAALATPAHPAGVRLH